MNKQELIKKIKKISDISDKEKSYLIDLVNTKKKYGLVWENKPEDVEEQLRSMLPVFKEVKERAIISEDKTAPNHILIEGDNLHALTALTYTHEEKIDVIYIDPPYNTGGKDFRYNDIYVDREDSFRHSKWLSFMEKRLQIAKKLLNNDGFIFISIDDNENAQLKLLCDEIFGEINFVGNIIRPTGTTTGQDTGGLGKAFDYLVAYAINPNYHINGIDLSENDLKRYNLVDEVGNFSILQLRRTGGEDRREDRPTMFFPIIAPDGTEVYPLGPGGYESRWRVGQETVAKMIKDNLLYFKKSQQVWKVYYKYYAENKTKRPSNIWDDLDGNKKAQIEMKDIFQGKVFETPKPMSLIKKILKHTFNKESDNFIVLDFFAGSGTTLHATMALNEEDGGNRQCILVTNNENNIAEEVTYERNKRVIQGYTNAKGDQVEGLINNNLRYYQSDFIPSARTEVNRRLLTARSTELLCIKENCYHCITADFGINPKQAQLFTDLLGRYMVVVYHSRSMEAVVEKLTEVIQGLETTEKVKIYAFSPEKDSIEDDFFAVQDKIETVPLPDSIYNAYRATFRTLKLSLNQAAASTQTQDN